MAGKKVKYVGTLKEFVETHKPPQAARLLRVPKTTLVDNLSAKRDHLVMEIEGVTTLLSVKSAQVKAA